MIDRPYSSRRWLSRARIDLVVAGSSPDVASSESTATDPMRVPGDAHPLFCPPESWAGIRHLRSPSPTRSRSSLTRRSTDAAVAPRYSRGSPTFWATVRRRNSGADWKMTPILRRAATSSSEGQGGEVLPVDANGAAGGAFQKADAAAQRALAGAAGSDDRQDLAVGHRQLMSSSTVRSPNRLVRFSISITTGNTYAHCQVIDSIELVMILSSAA